MQLMVDLRLKEIPDYHIMKRWTRGATYLVYLSSNPCSVMNQVSLPKLFRHNIMYVSALEMVKLGGIREAQYNIVMKHNLGAKKEGLIAPVRRFSRELEGMGRCSREWLWCDSLESINSPGPTRHLSSTDALVSC